MASRKSYSSWRGSLKDYGLGFVLGLGGLTLCFASIDGRITDDRALYENLTEIRARKHQDISFDGDIAALSNVEGRFREKSLPKPRPKVARKSYPAVNAKSQWRGQRRARSPRPASAPRSSGIARGRS